jgi:hypothetical protein
VEAVREGQGGIATLTDKPRRYSEFKKARYPMTTQKEARLAFLEGLLERLPFRFYRSAIRRMEDGILLTLSFTVKESFPELLKDPSMGEQGKYFLLSAAASDECQEYFEGTAFTFLDENYFSEELYERNYFISYEARTFAEDVKLVMERHSKKGK